MTADAGAMAHMGIAQSSQAVSIPVSPGGGGVPSGVAGDTGEVQPDGGTAGDTSGGGDGGGGAGGGEGGKLPFTGFPAAVAGVLGAGMASAGAAARRALERPKRRS